MEPLPPGSNLEGTTLEGPTLKGTTILQVLPRLHTGGVERGTVEIVAAITVAGGRALVASEGGRMAAFVERAGGRHVLLPLASKSPFGIWRNAGRLARLVRQEGVGILHARSRAPAWAAWLASRRTGVRFVTTYHGVYNEGAPGKRWYNGVMARGDRVIAISQYVADLIAARHGVEPARLRVIPRGVDPVLFNPERIAPDRMARLLQAWRVPDGVPVVMLPGRLTRWKGQGVLLDAMARLRHPDAVAVLVGDGRPGYARELERRAHALGIGERVRLAGHCEDMPAALMLAAVAVSASTEPEGFGRAVIEAQAMGVPTIVSDHGGAAETVDHLVTGWRVPPGDADALAAAIDHALGMGSEDLAALAERSRASVLARYTTAAMQAATLDVYRELL